MAVSAQQVMELRKKTNVAMLACKKALEESDGDIDKAIDLLRKRGEAKAVEKGDRETGEGAVAIFGRAIVSLLCETDFVARNEKFVELVQEIAKKTDAEGEESAKKYFESIKTDQIQAMGENLVLKEIKIIKGGDVISGYVHSNGKLGTIVALEGGTEEKAKDVGMHASAMNPLVANPDDVPADLIAKEKEIAKEQLLKEGKPPQIIDKILVGKIQKFCAEKALTSQPFVKNPDQTVGEYLGDAKLVAFIRLSV